MRPPPQEVNDAIENGVVEITRRIEIYERDATTLWYASNEDNPKTNRLVGGSITVDYNSDERRKGDLVLRNDDYAFRLNPRGGFYYDKVIKLYRGIRYPSTNKSLVALVETDQTGDTLNNSLRLFSAAGYEMVDKRTATTYSEIRDYPILVSLMDNAPTAKSTLLREAYDLGHNIFTLSHWNTTAQIPWINSSGGYTGSVGGTYAVSTDNPLRGKMTNHSTYTGTSMVRIVSLSSGQVIAISEASATDIITWAVATSKAGSYWLNHQSKMSSIPSPTAMTANLQVGLQLLDRHSGTTKTWEAQLGEFLIDGVNDQIFPNQIKVTIRDNTKKLLKDKLTFTSTFAAGTSLRTFVRAIAANGGITKFRESIGNETLPQDITHDRDTERWKIIKDVCTAFDYECFFDNEGYLVVRKFNDPTLSPIFHTFQTGSDGNLVSFDRSINDSRIYNIINIFGDPVNNDRLPYFGQARNDDPDSPTSTVKIGKRPWTFSANYFQSDSECATLAASRLKIMALESYDINFASIYYPWMEVGEIVQILDPNRNATDPTRFLMDQINLPIELGPMSGTGKRITIVGSSG